MTGTFIPFRAGTPRFRFAAILALLLPCPLIATNHQIRMDNIVAGSGGNTNIQCIQMVVNGETQKDWSRQGIETESRAMLVFFNGSGSQTGTFKFPNDPPFGASTVLIATEAFTNATGIRADIIMPPMIPADNGKVCFKGNPANPNRFTVNLCLSYGTFPPALTEGAGDPAPALPVTGEPRGLVRFQNFTFGDITSRNADFRLGTPIVTNTARQSIALAGPGPEIDASPVSVVFGNQPFTGGPSLPQSVTIRNLGTANPLSITNVSLIGIDADEFQIVTDSGQQTLGPLGTRHVTVTFDPTSSGTKTATLRVVSNDSDESTLNIPVQGTGSDFNPCAAPTPETATAKDTAADAQLVMPGKVYTGSTTNATTDGSTTCNSTSKDVWFKYAPASNGVLTVTLEGSSFDTVLSAHSRIPGTTTNQITCNDNFNGVQSRIQFPVTNGVEVLLRISGASTNSGSFQMTLTGPALFDFDRNTNNIHDHCELDFGDAPAPYPTLASNNGARHRAVSRIFLGKKIDVDADGQPSALANGDNLDDLTNDDDGVTLSTLINGASATATVIASTSSVLNAWLDVNADGDWQDGGEQILINRTLVTGTNILSFLVPPVQNFSNKTTFARFRVASTSNLSFTNLAIDGEVEDYRVEIISGVTSTNPAPGTAIRFSEMMAGLNGDSKVQFVELEVQNDASRAWGPATNETVGRAMLLFFDAAGEQVGRFVFPSNAPPGTNLVLIATRAFADLTGISPDFIMPPEVMPIAGKVAFRNNPANNHFNANIGLSYGGNSYFGPTDGAGSANPNRLPILGARSLRRTATVNFGTNVNSAFVLGAPSPVNTKGETFTFHETSLIAQGKTLFHQETFRGNGRTCASCHIEKDQFGLTPASISALPKTDPLFIFEQNVNRLKLVAPSQPSDLRGEIGDTNKFQILGGSSDTFLIAGGINLTGLVTDSFGNTGLVERVTAGDLNGPTASNGSSRGLEDHELLEHGRGLILENIDGFNKPEVFRASPHLLNLASTAPYGLSGEFADLRGFSEGAVFQHFPRSMARIGGVDFRVPTPEELVALESFQNSITHGAQDSFVLDHFVTTEAQKRGQALFFGDEGKCSKCHSGPALSFSDGSITNSIFGRNENFNTGVANQSINLAAGSNLPTEPPGLVEGESSRKFNTPPLFGVRLTAPFFHDNSAATLKEAVEFYDSVEFVGSPTAPDVGDIIAANDSAMIADLVAFLEALVEIPVAFPRALSLGFVCADEPIGVASTTFTNIGTNIIAITNVTLTGSNATEFAILSGGESGFLSPGEARSVELQFNPSGLGTKHATLEISANETNLLGGFSFGIGLTGDMVDNIASTTPSALTFLPRSIDDAPSAVQFITLTNEGSVPLQVKSIQLLGANAIDFRLTNNPSSTNIPPGETHSIGVLFEPKTRDSKFAEVKIDSSACSGESLSVSLSGLGTSLVTRFDWETIPSPQSVHLPFSATLSALDRTGTLVDDFTGTLNLAATTPTTLRNAILISEVDPGTPDAVELVNVSSNSVVLASGWQISFYDEISSPTPKATVTLPGFTMAPGAVIRLTEGGVAPGTFPNFSVGTDLFWIGNSTNIAVLVRNNLGEVIDFVTTGPKDSIAFPVFLPHSQWRSEALFAGAVDDVSSFQRVGSRDRNSKLDWTIAPRNIGIANSGITLPFPPFRDVAFTPQVTAPFTNGVWTGSLTVLEEARVTFVAKDDQNNMGSSVPVNVVGTPPFLSQLTNRVVNEDSPVLIHFLVEDTEIDSSELVVTVTSSNTVLVPAASLAVTALETNGASVFPLVNRALHFTPATNQFGTTLIGVSVSDGVSTSSGEFLLTVNPVNDAPIITPILNQTFTEMSSNTLNVIATDVDANSGGLRFSIPSGPDGASINETNGLLSWTPSEMQGATTNPISVRVVDDGTPAMSNTVFFSIFVQEANAAPVLAAITNQTIYAGSTLVITNTATDSDIPSNTLTFAALNMPSSAAFNNISGVFTWSPLETAPTSTNNLFRCRVFDNGIPSLSSTQSCTLSVIRLPVTGTRTVSFGTVCSDAIAAITLTNLGTNAITLLNAGINGSNAVSFSLLNVTNGTLLSPGSTNTIQVAFAPQMEGNHTAAIELVLSEGLPVGSFVFRSTLTGAWHNGVINAGPAELAFGTQQIQPPIAAPAQTITITNIGSSLLRITNILLVGSNASEFQISSDSGETNLTAGASRFVNVRFTPTTPGPKVAQLRLLSSSCSNSTRDIHLTGTGGNGISHFTFDPVASPQTAAAPFPVTIRARDFADALFAFDGLVTLSGEFGTFTNKPVLISEIDPGNPDMVEFMNVSAAPVDISGWKIVLYDPAPNIVSTTTIPAATIVPGGGIFRISESGTAPGTFPNFHNGIAISGWVGSTTTIAVMLLDAQNQIMDFASTSTSTGIVNPVSVPTSHWSGAGISAGVSDSITTYQRRGSEDHNNNTDWFIAPTTIGTLNSGLIVPFPGTIGSISLGTITFTNGVWSGFVNIPNPVKAVRLLADDLAGHKSFSATFDVVGSAPEISQVPDVTIDEDTQTALLPFTIQDADTTNSALMLTVWASNTNLVPGSNILLGGTGSNRTLRITPATNQFGTNTIFMSVSDGGLTNTRSFTLTVNPVNDAPTFANSTGSFSENFDAVSIPSLPSGWSALMAVGTGTTWQTVNSTRDTIPNSVFTSNPSASSDSRLTSPSFAITSTSAQISFRHSFNTEACCDGGQLEVSFNSGTFSNLTAVGGTFITNGYNSGTFWRGSSAGFITSVAVLPSTAAGKSVAFRWRFTTDNSGGGVGWFVDSFAINDAPIGNLIINEDTTGSTTFSIGDVETAASNLVLTATSSDQTLIPDSNISLVNLGTTRQAIVRPATNQFGTATITYALSDGEAVTTTVATVVVNPINDAPTGPLIGDQLVNEGNLFVLSNLVVDVDQTNAFTISSTTLPAGAVFDGNVFSWTPSEAQGPGIHPVSWRVSDSGGLSLTQSFAILVREVNSPPVLTNVPTMTVFPGELITFQQIASDSDLPPNTLSYTLAGAPPGPVLGSSNGIFTWTPTIDDIGNHLITIQVTDNGSPALSAQRQTEIIVVGGPTLHSVQIIEGAVHMAWEVAAGRIYQVQYKLDFNDPVWIDLSQETITETGTLNYVDASELEERRFYRVIMVE